MQNFVYLVPHAIKVKGCAGYLCFSDQLTDIAGNRAHTARSAERAYLARRLGNRPLHMISNSPVHLDERTLIAQRQPAAVYQ